MSDGFNCARSIAARAATAPSSAGWMSLNAPPYLPIGVRTALRMTMSRGSTTNHCSPLEGGHYVRGDLCGRQLCGAGEACAGERQSEARARVGRHELERAAVRAGDA